MRYSIGVDIGGTKIAAGIVDERKLICCQKSIPVKIATCTEDIVKLITHLVEDLLHESKLPMKDIKTIGVVVPGTANLKTRQVEYANNLLYCQGNLMEQLEYQLGRPVIFENDANAAAWGEYLVMKERPESMVMITLGTGIGAGIIVNGALFHGINFAAGEIGHMSIQMDGISCNCGRRGCYELYASATALGLQAKEAMRRAKESKLWELCHGNSSDIDARIVIEAVRLGDETATHIFKTYLKYLGTGIVNLMNLLQPELVVIGGGLSNAGELLLTPLKEMVEQEVYTRDSQQNPKLCLAQLKNEAGIIGAAFLGEERGD